jgi:hypothetical protein
MKNTVSVAYFSYENTGDIRYLDITIDTIPRLLVAMSDNHPDRALTLELLGNFTGWRYDKNRKWNDFLRAINATEELLSTMPLDQDNRTDKLFKPSYYFFSKVQQNESIQRSTRSHSQS